MLVKIVKIPIKTYIFCEDPYHNICFIEFNLLNQDQKLSNTLLFTQIISQGLGRRGKFWIEGGKITSREIWWKQWHCRIIAPDGILTEQKTPIGLGPDDKLYFLQLFTKDQSSLLVSIAFLNKYNFC